MKQNWIGALLLIFVALSVSSTQAYAQKEGADTGHAFKVEGHVLHAEAKTAEVCFTFSEPLSENADRAAILSALKIRKNGTLLKESADSLSLTPNDLCVQGLAHRASYQVSLRGLVSQGGRRQLVPYTASFVVPDRKASLSFVMDSTLPVLPRHVKAAGADKNTPWGMAHVLRSIGVLATHLTLYKIEDRAAFSGAWQQFKQAHLSPSESLTFAREKGKMVFESDLVFGDEPNTPQTLIAPLPTDELLAPGLYYLAATSRGQIAPTLFAGQWFLVSDLRMSVVGVAGGAQAFVFEGQPARAVLGAEVALLTWDGKTLATGKTNEEGVAFVALPGSLKAEGLLAQAAQGDGSMDLMEIGSERMALLDPQPRVGSISLDHPSYRPESLALVALQREGAETGKAETIVRLLRPDRQVLAETPVSPFGSLAAQTVSLSLPASAKAAQWTVSWQEKDGRVIAEAPIKIIIPEAAAKVSLSAIRNDDLSSGRASVSLISQDEQGRPLPYQEGAVQVTPARPMIEGWESYRFGLAAQQEGQVVLSLPFMTNGNGMALVNVDFDALEIQADAYSISAVMESGVKSAPTWVSASNRPVSIGLRSWSPARPFAENSIARFDIVALDRSKKRIAQNDLFFVVYEEGRSFDWFAGEGYWDYRPLPQHRRVGGGALSLSASEDNVIFWPVTMGRYILEITSSRGEVLARHAFEAGRRGGQEIVKDENKLRFGAMPDALQVGKVTTLPLHISAPAMVQVVVTDGTVRQTIHRAFASGEQSIVLTPAADWGRQVLVRVEASLDGALDAVMTSVVLPVLSASQDMDSHLASSPVSAPIPMAMTAEVPEVLRKGDRVPLIVRIENNGAEKGVYSYEIEGASFITIKGATSGKIDFQKKKEQVLWLSLAGQSSGAGFVQMTLSGVGPAKHTRIWPIRVQGGRELSLTTEGFKIEPGGTWQAEAKTSGVLLSPLQEPVSLLRALSLFVSDEPQTSAEIALWVEAARGWEQPLIGLGYATAASWQAEKTRRLSMLLRRQNEDGGFASIRAGQASDLASTAYALPLLWDSHNRAAMFAASWLTDKLKNTWFEEGERSDRALAFEALARIKRLDISALRYFAEKSQDKTLPTAAMMAIASALRQGGDDAAALKWEDKAKASPVSWEAARFAVINEKIDSSPLIAKLTQEDSALSPPLRAAMLTSLAQSAVRVGSWRVDIGGVEAKHFGFRGWKGAASDGKTVFFRNTSDRVIFGLRAQQSATKKPQEQSRTVNLTLELHRSNGELIANGQPLEGGATYVLTLHGQGQKDRDVPLRLVVPRSAGFSAFMPLSGSFDVVKGIAPWQTPLGSSLTEVVSENGNVSFKVDASHDFSTAVYLRAEKTGSYLFPPVIAWDSKGDVDVQQNEMMLKIGE